MVEKKYKITECGLKTYEGILLSEIKPQKSLIIEKLKNNKTLSVLFTKPVVSVEKIQNKLLVITQNAEYLLDKTN